MTDTDTLLREWEAITAEGIRPTVEALRVRGDALAAALAAAEKENARLSDVLAGVRFSEDEADRNVDDLAACRERAERAEAALKDALGVGYTIATGKLFCPFPAFHEAAERLLGRPILTHELADKDIYLELREAIEAEALAASPGAKP